MNLVLTEDQALLASSARNVLEKEHDFQERRRRGRSGDGTDPAVWRLFADMGWLGLPLPEAYGGFDAGSLSTGLVLEAMGRQLVVEPYLACVVQAARLIAECGSADQCQEWLPDIAAGRRRLALAHEPDAAGGPWSLPRTQALRDGDAWVLHGPPLFVTGAAQAHGLVVSTRQEALPEVQLFLLDVRTPGLRIVPGVSADGLAAADVHVQGLRVRPAQLLGPDHRDPGSALQRVCAEALVGSCWEASGAIAAAYEQTVAYTRQRRQFGQAIADFQVIQHRLAEMAVCRTEARAACELASLCMERGDADECAIASAAKVKVGRCADYVAKEAVQLHGAIGTTDELPISSYFRKLTVFNTRGGSPQSHARALGRRMIASGAWRESRTLGAPQAQRISE